MQTLTKYTWLFILMLSMTTGLEAQTQQQYIDAAEEYYEYGDYANAAFHFGEAMDFDTTDQNLRFRRAESNLRYKAYKQALLDLERLERDGALPNFPRLPYLQGKAAQPLGLYDVAIDHFSLFLTNTGNAPAYEVADAKRQLSNSNWAKDLLATYNAAITAGTQDQVYPIHYADVNTRFDDFGPTFERDRFYFSSLRFRVEKDSISPTRKVARILRRNAGGNIALNNQLPESINQKNRTAAHSAFNTAGTTVYFTYCGYRADTLSMRCDLYSASVGTDGEWGTPQKLGINADGANNTHPNVGMHPDGSEHLYFASNRSGGRGMHDLYRAPIGADGTLGSVEPLTELNTPFDEVTPFYFAPQRELYFSTDGRNTLGGLDIYRVSVGQDGWLPPVHLGLPTNSSYNDVYYGRIEERDTAYFASNRYTAEAIFWDEEEDVCCNDIYKVEIEKICLEVTTWHCVTGEALNATTVTFYEEFPNGERAELAMETNPDDNLYTFEVEKGRKYFVTGTKRGFKGDEETFEMLLMPPKQAQEVECIKKKLNLCPPIIKLEVATFSELDESRRNECEVDNGFGLNGTTVDLYSEPNEQRQLLTDVSETKIDDNFYSYTIEQERFYELSGMREGYTRNPDIDSVDTPDIASVDTRGLFVLNDTTICRNLLLKPRLNCDIKPKVFFHNDIPVKNRPFTTTTDSDYITTYYDYLGLQRKYETWAGNDTELTAELTTFFQDSVYQGGKDLEDFAATLLSNLAKGDSLTVTLKGFASPLSTGPYNDQLSARRGISVINYLLNYDKALSDYIKAGVILVFNKESRYRVPKTYLDVIPVQQYTSKGNPPEPPNYQLVFDIQAGGEVDFSSGNYNFENKTDESIYHPLAARSRYVEVKIGGCPE